MVTEITQGIKVTVETEYQPAYSSPTQYHYVFTYRITIENQSDHTIQLMRRHWHIFDAGFTMREVEGEGVVGQSRVGGQLVDDGPVDHVEGWPNDVRRPDPGTGLG